MFPSQKQQQKLLIVLLLLFRDIECVSKPAILSNNGADQVM